MEFDLDSSSSQVTPKQLAALRSWIDTFPFMNEEKKKGFRSIGRDFADGVRVAKIIKCYFPRIIEIHNYSQTSSTHGKVSNWAILNRKVLTKHFEITLQQNMIDQLVTGNENMVQQFLIKLNKAIIKKMATEQMLVPDEQASPYSSPFSSPRKVAPINIPSSNDKSVTSVPASSVGICSQNDIVDNLHEPFVEKASEKYLKAEYEKLDTETLLIRAEELRKPFEGFPYCNIKAGRPLSELNLAFMSDDCIRVLVEKEAALAASLEALEDLQFHVQNLLSIKQNKDKYYQSLTNKITNEKTTNSNCHTQVLSITNKQNHK